MCCAPWEWVFSCCCSARLTPEWGPGLAGTCSDWCPSIHRGGIQDGDIIVKVNGRPLADSSELQEAVLTESPLLLEVRRGNDDLLFSIAPEVVL